ncbi:MAG: hypothetical protein M1385_01015 [Candidatus Marsarchaeota archaeon]|nr:hypothetical protein [Candidatus Marsarchaeota archaeon]
MPSGVQKISIKKPLIFSQSVTPPTGVLYSIPIKLINSQNAPTPINFQQELTIYLNKSYMASGLQNVEFFYPNGSIITSWMQSYNTTNLGAYYFAIYWLKLNAPINSNSNETIYMGVGSVSTNFFNSKTTGEAPQLSQIYGEYDNGFNVFNLYDNFAGRVLNTSKWNSCSGYIVDNGYTANTSKCSGAYSQMPAPKAPSGSLQNPSTGIVSMYISNSSGNAVGTPVVCWLHMGGYCNPSVGVNNGALLLYSGAQGADSYFYGIDIITANSLSSYQKYTINWMFISYYPPNGVMPTYEIASSPAIALSNISLLSGWSGGSFTFPSPVPVGPQVYSNGTITAVLTNYAVSVYTNSGSYIGLLPSKSLGWNGYGINPQFYYDHLTNRWIIITDADPNVDIGVSKTGNILGQWYNYSIPENGDSDYTQMAVSQNNLVITADIFTIGGGYFVNSTIFVVNKTKLIKNNELSFSKLVYPSFLFPQPLTPVGSVPNSVYVVSSFATSTSTGIFNISGPAESPIIKTYYLSDNRHSLEVFSHNFSDGPTGSNTIQATGGQGGIIYKGNIWYGFDTTCNTHSTQCIHVMEINISTGNILQTFNIDNNTNMNFVNPSFSADGSGDIIITFEYGNATAYGSLGAAVQLSSAQPNTISYFIPLKAGIENVGGRYGDWSGSSTSPNGDVIYSAGQYAGNFGESSLWIQAFSINHNAFTTTTSTSSTTSILSTTSTIPTTSTLSTTTISQSIPSTSTTTILANQTVSNNSTTPTTTISGGGGGGFGGGGGGSITKKVIPNIDILGYKNMNVTIIYNSSDVLISAYNNSNPDGIIELLVNQILENYSGGLSFGFTAVNYTMKKNVGEYNITAISVSGNKRTVILRITNNATAVSDWNKKKMNSNSTSNANSSIEKRNNFTIINSSATIKNNSTISINALIKHNTIGRINIGNISIDLYPKNSLQNYSLNLALVNKTGTLNNTPVGYSKLFVINLSISKYNGSMAIMVNKTINCGLLNNYAIFQYQYGIWFETSNYTETEKNNVCNINFPYNGSLSGIFISTKLNNLNNTNPIQINQSENLSVHLKSGSQNGTNQTLDYIYDIIIIWLILFILYELQIIVKANKNIKK